MIKLKIPVPYKALSIPGCYSCINVVVLVDESHVNTTIDVAVDKISKSLILPLGICNFLLTILRHP
jgi:hypothetical protein